MNDAKTAGIRIQVNGEPRVTAPGSVLDFLRSLDVDPRTVVVELNRRIVRRPDLDATSLNQNDEIELVHFVGGG